MRSLRRQILWLVSSIVLGTVVVCSVAAYVQFERALERTAALENETVATRLSNILERSATEALREADAVRTLLARDTMTRNRRAALTAYAASRPDLVGAGIWSPDSDQHLWVPGSAGDSVPSSARLFTATAGSAGIGPIQSSNHALFYDITIPIGPDSTRSEKLVLRRYIAAGEIARVLPKRLGNHFVVLIGTPGGAWSDLSRQVVAPQPDSESLYRWKGDSIYNGATVRVENTAWNLWVGMPRARLLAPARALAVNITLAGLAILLVAIMVTALLTGRLSEPLLALNSAITEVAEGQYRQRVPVAGSTDIAEVARSFNLMADRIEEDTDRLEHQAELRARELEAALSELRQTQEQLIRSEQLATLGQLANNVGHELRTPLRVMTNAVYYLEMISHNLPPTVREYHGILRYQILLAEKIVADLLDFARIGPPQKERVELRKLIEKEIERLGTLHDVSLTREYDPAAGSALVDPRQIGLALFNILTNAAQVLEGQGSIRVRTYAGTDVAGISVEDSGPGIDREMLPRIFDPLFTTKPRGVGLGLSVARGLVHANNGRIMVASEAGQGTTFSIELPTA